MGSSPEAAAEWHLRHRAAEPSFAAQARAARERILAAVDADRPVLDLGCGTGPFAAEVLDRGGRWIGLDRDPAMAAGARWRTGRTRALVGEAARLPFADRAFGAVVSLGLFEYLVFPERVLAEAARVVRPGGAIVVTVPRREAPGRRWLGAAAPLLRALGRPDPFDLRRARRIRPAVAARWAAAAGMPLTEVRRVVPAVLPWPIDRFLPGLVRRLAPALPERLGTVWLFRFTRPADRG